LRPTKDGGGPAATAPGPRLRSGAGARAVCGAGSASQALCQTLPQARASPHAAPREVVGDDYHYDNDDGPRRSGAGPADDPLNV